MQSFFYIYSVIKKQHKEEVQYMNITEAKILMKHLQDRKEQLAEEIKDVDAQMLSLKIAIADMVLNQDTTEDEDKVPMVQIQFKTDGPIYDYLWTDYREPEEYVYVEKIHSDEYQAVKCLGVVMKEPDPDLRYKVAYYEGPND